MGSNLNIFKIGVGPSSSHTLGPMLAGNLFCKEVAENLNEISRIEVILYGSLSLTGKGHLSDKAVIWGLNALEAKNLSTAIQDEVNKNAIEKGKINFCGVKELDFNYNKDLIFSKDFLPLHENGMQIKAYNDKGVLIKEQTYYSVGGGFVLTASQLEEKNKNSKQNQKKKLNIELNNAKEALEICDKKGWDLAKLSYEYELQFHTREEIYAYCLEIWEVMQEVYYNGTHPKQDYLPGKLHLKRRAKGLKERVATTTDPMGIIDFISLYAIAIAEENASGAKVVTAPTNGACAVIPAVMLYLKNHTIGFNDEKVIEFLLTAMLIGSFYKKNASISGAEAGCQAEIGSASSMAAAAMATVLGANAFKACNAAEMAMEHHLGLTCDPVGGLVQIPCIERNAFGAIKAISAARMAMTRKSTPMVTLDEVIETMYETGKDMNYKYKETSLGGLAINLKTVC
ncbi:L-serine ammonia-lyase [Campylobacter sp. VicNov18]|uniref:L-serine ammonia-lyase n=1 Tax=Campylobacter bilis TaxID=2691918 RepID=UPI00130D5DB8|nr:L-serine ammonia-lyase [Campylobacter bilis]MPV63766.1 L-serine ammonia-lyase [Campylobacter hepaticus]MBM0637267.1 L-serine ammonia-lyase [Campylobacter bilis]MCC8277986.1 L-serine ammonia-lyase [Campylobacter bilis]MCC8299490.1 L-serine ammonia-lyase [Campylobacter bilis]MCC8300895.1 L-serine ammonia-lyase [Campylobacter bilis]